jgi:hypothetical protein
LLLACFGKWWLRLKALERTHYQSYAWLLLLGVILRLDYMKEPGITGLILYAESVQLRHDETPAMRKGPEGNRDAKRASPSLCSPMKRSLSFPNFMAAFTHFRKDEAEWPKTRPNTKYGGAASRTTQTLDLPMPIHHTRAIVSPSICSTLFAGPRCEQCAMSVRPSNQVVLTFLRADTPNPTFQPHARCV